MTEVRSRYEPEHWARIEDPARALELYLDLCCRPMNQTKIDIIARMLPADLTGYRVLDYGAGGGYFTVLCARRGAEVVAVDAEATALRTAAHYAAREGVAGRCTFLQADAFPRQLEASRFDLVLAKDVIEHVGDDAGLLRAFAGSQRSGARLIASTQNSLSLTYAIEGFYNRVWLRDRSWCGWDPTHLRFYTPRSLGLALGAAGYMLERRHGIYIVPYRILTYALGFRRWIEIPALRYVDLWLGGRFPLNLFGWDMIVAARKA